MLGNSSEMGDTFKLPLQRSNSSVIGSDGKFVTAPAKVSGLIVKAVNSHDQLVADNKKLTTLLLKIKKPSRPYGFPYGL